MYTFNKAFEQFKNNVLNLALINLLYSLTVSVSSFVLNCYVPVVGPFLHIAVLMISIPVYIRILMQVVNGETSTSFDKAMEGIMPVAGKIFLLNFIKGIILTLVAIPCMIFGVFNAVSGVSYYDFGLETVIRVLMSIGGSILIILIVAFVLELILGFVSLLMSDKDFAQMSFKDSLVNGFKMMKGYRCRFVFIQIINVFLIFIGFLMLGVGIFFTSPLSTLLILNLYKEAKDNYLGYSVEADDMIEFNQDSKENNIEFDNFLKKD